jgi:hypothetical protein
MTMKSTAALFPVLTLAVLISSACAGPETVTAPVLPTATPMAEQPTSSLPAYPAPSDQKTVTLDDQGKTVRLTVGDRFLLKLGEVFSWEVTVSDPSVVDRVTNITVVRGAQGVYEALKTGTVTLTASGTSLCQSSAPPCGTPGMEFSVTLVVAK